MTATGTFTLEVPRPTISSVNPSVQARGAPVTISVSDFDTNTCMNNQISMISLRNITTTASPSSCTPTTISFLVPPNAPFGSQQLSVWTSGLSSSNSVPLTVARQTGNFAEITTHIEGQVGAGTCGTVQLQICGPNCPGYARPYVATFLRAGTQIGQPIEFYRTNSRVSNLGGAGFGQCSIGVVLDGDTTRISPQLLGIEFLDFESGQTFPPGGEYTFNYVTPDGKASYIPRIFQSPDGTLQIVVHASNYAPAQFRAAVFDAINPSSNLQMFCDWATMPLNVSASVLSTNQVSVSGGGTTTACTINIQ